MSASGDHDDFAVDAATHLLSGLAVRFGRAFKALGRLETRMLEEHLGEIRRPVFVTGLARSGTTTVLEILSWQPGAVTHRYRDFPMLHTPVMWDRYLGFAGGDAGPRRERAHKDGILITRDSPEAFEEVLWVAYFQHLHDPARSNVLDGSVEAPEFERAYRDHIRKLLWLRGGDRYVSKGNYNVTRLDYLRRLFPDARFVVPVRNPHWHVASLQKQHRLFLAGQGRQPRAVAHLARAGHFEFGTDRRAINTGDAAAAAAVTDCWSAGREVEGWARYWSMIYDFVLDRLKADPALAEATLLLPYEALCSEPARTTEILFAHCGFPAAQPLLERAGREVRFPDYYRPDLSAADRALISRLTGRTAGRLREYCAAAAPDLAAGPPPLEAGGTGIA